MRKLKKFLKKLKRVANVIKNHTYKNFTQLFNPPAIQCRSSGGHSSFCLLSTGTIGITAPIAERWCQYYGSWLPTPLIGRDGHVPSASKQRPAWPLELLWLKRWVQFFFGYFMTLAALWIFLFKWPLSKMAMLVAVIWSHHARWRHHTALWELWEECCIVIWEEVHGR